MKCPRCQAEQEVAKGLYCGDCGAFLRQPIRKADQVSKQLAHGLTTAADGHQHPVWVRIDDAGDARLEVGYAAGEGDGDEEHTHAVARDAAGAWSLGAARGHNHDLPDLARFMPAGEPATKRDGNEPKPAGKCESCGGKRSYVGSPSPERAVVCCTAEDCRLRAVMIVLGGTEMPETATTKLEKANQELETIAGRFADRDPSLTPAEAIAKALETPAGEAAYAVLSRPDLAAEAAAAEAAATREADAELRKRQEAAKPTEIRILEGSARELAKARGLTYEAAFDAVLETEEGAALFDAAYDRS